MVRLRYPKIAACFGGIVLLVVIVSAFMGSGKAWITLFGTDFGYSCQSKCVTFTKAPGGFFDWWTEFAERDYQEQTFGFGYDTFASGEYELAVPWPLPEASIYFDGAIQELKLPLWMPIAIIFCIALLFVRISNKSPNNMIP